MRQKRDYRVPISPLVLALILGAIPIGRAIAQVNDYDVEGWTPGMALVGGLLFNEIEGRIATTDILGPGANLGNPDQPIQPFQSGEDLEPAPFVGTAIELMSPTLGEGWSTRPRVFVHADFSLNFAQEDDLARNLDPKPTLSLPEGTIGRPIDEKLLLGQGARSSIEIEPLSYGAGLGMAFETVIFDQIIRIKPSIEYYSFAVQMSGIVSRGVNSAPGPFQPDMLSDFRHILLEARRTKRFHGLGPGLEIETDAGRFGPLVTSVFLSGRVYSLFGNLDIRETVFNTSDPDPLAQQENARFSSDVGRWLYRGSVGVRLRWAPKR